MLFFRRHVTKISANGVRHCAPAAEAIANNIKKQRYFELPQNLVVSGVVVGFFGTLGFFGKTLHDDNRDTRREFREDSQQARKEFREDFQMLAGKIDGVQTSLNSVKEDVAGLKSDVSVLKSDVSVLKSDVAGLKSAGPSLRR